MAILLLAIKCPEASVHGLTNVLDDFLDSLDNDDEELMDEWFFGASAGDE